MPYDSALAIVADPAPLAAAMALTAAYLVPAGERERNGADWSPEASRRARAFPLYAALRGLGRRGVAELVERDCALAARIAELLAAEPGVEVLNDVVLNQALVRFGGDDAATDAVIAARAGRTASAGSAARSGTASPRCGSRSPAGRRPRPTPTAARGRSRRRGAISAKKGSDLLARIGSGRC